MRDGRPARTVRRARGERVQPADVGQDHDPGATALGRLRERGREAGSAAEVSSSSSAPAPPAIGASNRSVGGAGGRASNEKRMTGTMKPMTDSTTQATDAATFRAQFPVFERSRTSTPAPRARSRRRAAEAVHRRVDLETLRGRCGRAVLRGADGAARQGSAEGYARAIGATPADVALTGSTTDGINTVIGGLDLRAGDEILTTDEEHPGLLAPLGRARRRHGISVRVVPFARDRRRGDARDPADRLLARVLGRRPDRRHRRAVGDRRAGAARRRAGDRRDPGRRRGARLRLLRRLRVRSGCAARRAAAASTCARGASRSCWSRGPGTRRWPTR